MKRRDFIKFSALAATAAQWPANLAGMVDAKFVALDETDLNLVLKYLQHNAKKVK